MKTTPPNRDIFLREDRTLDFLRSRLGALIPDAELVESAAIIPLIEKLKRDRKALILGHNYMDPVLFNTIPDVVGDSLELSRRAADTDADVIVFCGVRFMAETAKLLSPDKVVLLPAVEAGCSLAASIDAHDVRALRDKFPSLPIVAYVNTYAEVKAEVDICCTSGNAKRIADSFGEQPFIFLPDEYLARNVAAECGKEILLCSRNDIAELPDELPKNSMLGWRGRCEVHEQFSVEDITQVREQFDDVAVVAHPECSPEVVDAADYAASTSKMVEYVRESKAKHFLILTECSMGDNIIAENPDKDILRLCSVRCPHMNQITLRDTLHALQNNETLITLPTELVERAALSVQRMIAM